MEFLVAFATMITVCLLTYGLFYRAPADQSMDARLGGLRYQGGPRRPEPLPDPEAGFKVRVMKPVAAALAGRASSMLPSSWAERLQKSLIRAGVKVTPGQFAMACAITAGVLPLLSLALFVSSGMTGQTLLMMYGSVQIGGILLPRMWLQGRIKNRQKKIWRSLPDAFDLITASVEAGLGIDAAFARVVDKVQGPFAEELTRTLREIQMGRARRDALVDMADRTGVDQLQSLVNAIVQAESMGISIGSVIRVQTGVIRTKRRQKAEEAAFKAPIKMVFPLVFFIFPCIMIVIGGPAVIQLQNGFK
jgi:tight adherence protein C